MLSFIIGITCVNENPESTTIQHSGGGDFGSANNSPEGMSAAAITGRREFIRVQGEQQGTDVYN
jgi:hypothetical protein